MQESANQRFRLEASGVRAPDSRMSFVWELAFGPNVGVDEME
jgi:hypothetical protein